MASEDGWNPAWVGQDALEWTTVPGTNPPVKLQLMKGWPLQVMRAYAADYNAYVEPLRDADSAGYTPTNSVSTSNHLNGTAMDLNWDSHPFRVADAGYDAAKIATMREILDFYEGMMFWANDWDTPKDAMHHQLGYSTFNNPKMGDFIQRKIRSDGFSTFRRGELKTPVPTAVLASSTTPNPDAVAVLAEAMGNTLDTSRYAELLPAVEACLHDCGCTTVPRIAMWMAQIGTESGGLKWMEELASGAEYEGRGDLGNTQAGDGARFKGRGPIQVTGRHNYTVLSQWAAANGLVRSPTFFLDNPEELSSDRFGFTGVTWYWTTQRKMNDASDARDINLATRYVNGGLHGIEDRTSRYNNALAMGDKLLQLVVAAPPAAVAPTAPATKPASAPVVVPPGQFLSRSGYRNPGEGAIGDTTQFVLNDDALIHTLFVEWGAIECGDLDAIYRIVRAAAGKGADTSPAFIRRSRNALRKVPRNDLSTVLTVIEKNEPDLLTALMGRPA